MVGTMSCVVGVIQELNVNIRSLPVVDVGKDVAVE
jgi:hypothetical protein